MPIDPDKPLTPREEAACREYLIDYSPVKAMIRAGYAKITANSNSGKLFKRANVQKRLKEMAEQVASKAVMTAERVITEMSNIATANLCDYYKYSPKKKKWVLKSLDELTPEQQRCVAKYKPGEFMELHSKDGALDKLAKHYKLYTDISTTINNLVVMPEMKLNGTAVVFQVGKPAPKVIVEQPK